MKPTILATPPYVEVTSCMAFSQTSPQWFVHCASSIWDSKASFHVCTSWWWVKLFLPWYQRLSNQVKLACHISLQARDNAGWEGTRREYKSWYQCRMWHPVSLWRGSDILQRCVHSQNSPIEVWEHSHAFPHLKHVVASAIPVRGSWLVFSHSKHVLWSIITGMCWPGKLCQHGC